MKDPNQLEINFPEQQEESSTPSYQEDPYQETPREDLYERFKKMGKEKKERGPEYYEIKEILGHIKEVALKNISLIAKEEMSMNSKEDYEKIKALKKRLSQNRNPKSQDLNLWLGVLTITRKASKLISEEPENCLKYLKDLPYKGGLSAQEVVQSSKYDELLALLKKICL